MQHGIHCMAFVVHECMVVSCIWSSAKNRLGSGFGGEYGPNQEGFGDEFKFVVISKVDLSDNIVYYYAGNVVQGQRIAHRALRVARSHG